MKKTMTKGYEHREACVRFIEDAAAFLRTQGEKEVWNREMILATLIHDITGLSRREPCFMPRVNGYAEQRERRVAHQ